MKRIYFMKPIGMTGPIKIGCSKMPEDRLKSLDIWSPFPLEILTSADGDHGDERRLHYRFRNDHSHGEWFWASPDLLNLIDHVRCKGSLPPLEAVPSGQSGAARKNPGRNVTARYIKTQTTSRLSFAEAHAFGCRYEGRELRPARIQELIDSYQGPFTPAPSLEVIAEIDAYAETLRARPKARIHDWRVRSAMINVARLARAVAA